MQCMHPNISIYNKTDYDWNLTTQKIKIAKRPIHHKICNFPILQEHLKMTKENNYFAWNWENEERFFLKKVVKIIKIISKNLEWELTLVPWHYDSSASCDSDWNLEVCRLSPPYHEILGNVE